MASPLPTTLKIPVPEQIIAGKYRIIERIGSGGMALVFLAEQVGVSKRVALKFLDPEPGDDTRVQRFLREAKVGLEVQHPGAAQVLDLGKDEEDRLFLCFELVEGEDLRELIKREGRLSWGEAKEIVLQVAQVLAFAHARAIVHRDIKPENIRVRRDLAGCHVKVLDFGIARLLKDTGVRLTAEGMLAGTPRYMAPEQVKDEPLDQRTDLYSLGLVFYEMLTGTVAMGGRNVTQILMHQMQTLVPPLSFVDPALAHNGIDGVIAKACAKEPVDRYRSMAEFIDAVVALKVDESSWPPPRLPDPAGAAAVPTRDMKGQMAPAAPTTSPAQPAGAGSGLSDTFIRVPQRTELERRVEVPTDPVREPVQRGVRSGAPEGATVPVAAHVPSSERATEPPSLEHQVPAAIPRPVPEVKAAEKSNSKKSGKSAPRAPPPPALDLPTDPERPAVKRDTVQDRPEDRPIVAQTVVGAAVPRRGKSRTGMWVGLIIALISISAIVWWFLHSG